MIHTSKIYLNFLYSEKDECKQIGARCGITKNVNGMYLLALMWNLFKSGLANHLLMKETFSNNLS